MECPFQPSGGGTGRERSQHHERSATRGDTLLQTNLDRSSNLPSERWPTAASARQNKRTTSTANARTSNKRSRTTKSSRTSARVSTSSGKAFYEWWTPSCREMSSKLWLPTVTDSAASPSTSSSGYVTRTERHSWSRITRFEPQNRSSPRISWPSYTSSHADTTVCVDTGPHQTCHKIRLRPTTEQARVLRMWMKGHRDTYNAALRLVKDKKAKPTLGLKKLVVTAREEDNARVKAMKESTPAKIRQRAVLDLIDVYKSAWAAAKKRTSTKTKQKRRRRRHQNGGGSARHQRRTRRNNLRRWKVTSRLPFEVSYKSSRLTSDSFGMEDVNVRVENCRLFLFRGLKIPGMVDGIRLSESLKSDITQCCRIQYFFGRWYFLLPFKTTIESRQPTQGIAALDPGVRTFQTFYHEDGAGEICCSGNGGDALDRAHAKILSIRDAIDGASGPKKNRLRRAWYRHQARAKHLVADLHYKTIAVLFDSFDVVIAPRLSVTQMVRREFGLSKKTKARMRALCHGLFHQRLHMKAKLRGKTVYDIREHGTSRTCSTCGRANHKLGASKTFRCIEASCASMLDRDINASKNHLLKFLVGNNHYE